MPPFLLFGATYGGLALAALLAVLRGSTTDRVVVAAFIVNEISSGLLINHHGWDLVQWGPFIADVLLLALLLWLSARRPGVGLIVLSVLQLTMVGVHIARLLPEKAHDAGYASALFLLTISEVLTLVVAGVVRVFERPTGHAPRDLVRSPID